MKQIDYLRKSRKNCSALLMACALTFMLLTTTLSFAQTNSLTLGCPTASGNSYQYAALSLTAGDGVVRSISISFSENPDGCSISLPSTSWTVSGNEYSRYIIPAEGATSAQIEAFLQGVIFNVPSGTLKGVNIILSIDNASRQVFYFAGNGHYYEYVPYTGTKSWTDAYNEAKGLEYCGRPGYLATLTTAEEDAFVTRIVQNAMWIGGTRLSPTDDATSTGTQYYANFDTDDEVNEDNTDYWYWACGPEKGARITNEGAITNSNEQLSWYTQQPREPNGYTNWMYAVGRVTGSMYSAEPNNSGNESCLTVLRLGLHEGAIYTRKSENTSTTIGNYVFGWNDVTYEGNNSSSAWRPQGYLVEYGDQSIGHSQTDEACSISASGLVGNATRTVKATLSGSTAVCAGGTATLNITFEGGAYPFTGSVQGNNGEVVHFNTNDISYNFTVTPNETTAYTISAFSDASSTGEAGCEVYTINYTPSGSATVTVNNPQVALTDIAPVAICAGASTTLTATTTETATGEVSYAWSTGATGSEITVTPSETTIYTVTATATQGECTATATKSVTVTVNALPTATVSVTDVKCKGAGDGIITVNATGGSGSYQYQLGTGDFQNSNEFTGLNVGSYTLTVKDGNSCTTTTMATIDEPAQLTLTIVSATYETCTGNDGTINYTIAGGTAGYDVVLSDGSATQTATQAEADTYTFTGLKAGTYTVTVTDDHECEATATATVTLSNNFTVTPSNTAVCSGETFTVNPTASHAAQYSWSAPSATGITGAAAGTDASNISGTLTNTDTSATSITYTVTATTANGLCTATPFDVEVTVYAPVTGGSIQKNFISCNVADTIVTLTNVTAGNGGYDGTYSWEKSTDNGTTWTTIPNSNGADYTPSYHDNLGTVLYRRMYDANCDEKPSDTVSVTYYGNIVAGDVTCTSGCAENYCSGSSVSVTLSTSNITVQSGASYSIQWQQSIDNGANWTDISGETSNTYTYTNPNFTSPIQFRYTITVTGCAAVPSNRVHKIGVWELPVVSITDVPTLCPSAASTDIIGTINPPTTPNYTYYWIPGSGLTLPNLPESPTSATSDTIRGTFLTTNCSATYSASLYVVDGNGCKSKTATKTFTVVDTEAPVISGTLDTINVEGCTVSAAPAAYTTVSELIEAGLNITDNCGLQETVTSKQTSTGSCPIVITRTYTVKDLCGDSATVSQMININQADFTMPANGSSTVTCASEIVAPTLPEVKDACNNVLAPIGEPVISATPECDGEVTYTYTYKDCANHSHDWVYTYTIEHEDFIMPANDSSTVDCPSATDTPPTLPTITDACGDTLSPIGDPVVSTKPVCEGKRTYTYTYRDCAGHSHEWTYTYTIEYEDFEMPENGSKTVACASEISAPTLPTVTDNCGDTLTGVLKSGYPTATPSCEGTVTYVYTFTDCEGNSHDWTYTYTIEHPTLTFSGSITDVDDVDACYSESHKSQLLTADQVKAMYTSSCSREITVSTNDVVVSSSDCNWKITRTYSISDGGCNTDSKTMSVSGSDQTAPAIGTDDLDSTLTSTNCVFKIPDLTTEVRNISNDLCTPNADLIISQSPVAGTVLAQTDAAQNVTVTVTVKDLCGNESTKEVVVVVPAKVTVMATATPATICYGATSQLTATPSNVVGTATYNWTPSDGLNNATIANPVATLTTTTTYTVEVTDENGCAATATTTVNVNPEVVMDTVAPMTLCVGDVTSYSFTTPLTVGTMSYAWTNSNTAIGLAASGNGNLPSFTPTNTTNAPINATITVTPSHTYNGITCVGDPINFTITVRPSITTPGNVEFACPADTTVVLSYSDCEQLVNIGEPEFVNHMLGMNVNITNDAPAGNIFPEGTTVVTWTATDDCGDTLTCTQNVVIQFPPCGDSIADFDGYRYSSVRIGCQCWTGENARSEHYSDGTPVDNFRYYNDSDSLENIYGKLYTWYTAVRVPEGDNNAEPSTSTDPFGSTYVQGICPEGWALPTVDEYMLMIANSGDATHAKDGSNLYWLPGYEGQPPFSGFDAYGAGKYNGAIDRYQELLGKTHFWTTLSGSGSETATTVEINYYCAEGLQTELSKGDGVSIRCIRKR